MPSMVTFTLLLLLGTLCTGAPDSVVENSGGVDNDGQDTHTIEKRAFGADFPPDSEEGVKYPYMDADENIQGGVPPSIDGQPDKRYFGSVLGGGFSFGKRDDDFEKGMDDKRRFGSILGHGFSFGKRGNGLEADMPDKRYFGSILGRGFSFGKRENGLEEESPDKRRFGSILGHGFSFGKRDNDLEKRYFGHVLGRGFSFGKRDDDFEKGMDDKRHFGSILGHGFSFGKRDYDQTLDKRYFGNVLGRGFSFGKRGDEQDNHIPEKRYFGNVLGHGFSFGKRGDDSENEMPDKRHFGSILGRGFAFGKRDDDLENEMAEKRRFGSILGHGFSFGKRDSDLENEMTEKRRFGSILGHGFSFGKRQENTNRVFEDGFIPEKRYGYLLGNGFAFGKRDSADSNDVVNDKRSFGNIMGHGFTGFGKRTMDDESSYNTVPDKRRIGYVIGRGFAFGKRDDSAEAEDFQKRQFGHVLGHGFSFGKRDYDALGETPDKRYFGNVLGRGFSFGKREDSNNHGKRYFASDFGSRFDWTKRTVDDIQFINNDDSPDNEESLSKRAFGRVLGRGYMFGKRSGDASELDNSDMAVDPQAQYKRYGSSSGQRFSPSHPLFMKLWLGKRTPEMSNPPVDEAMYEGDDFSKRFSTWLRNRYFSGNHKRYGHLLGNGFAMGKRGPSYEEANDDSLEVGDSFEKRGFPFIMRPSYKRFGHILGGGFAFGKRNGEDVGLYIPYPDDSFVNNERTFSNGLNQNLIDDDKPAIGSILGDGFRLGKRQVEFTDDHQLAMGVDEKEH